MTKKILMLLLIFMSVCINAQNNSLSVDQIKKSGDYYWGQSAVCDSYEKAKKNGDEFDAEKYRRKYQLLSNRIASV